MIVLISDSMVKLNTVCHEIKIVAAVCGQEFVMEVSHEGKSYVSMYRMQTEKLQYDQE